MAKDDVGNNAKGTDTPAGREREQRERDVEALEGNVPRRGEAGQLGQIEENRNLTGSSTWETLPEDVHQHARRGQAASPREDTHNEPPRKKEGHGTHPPGRA